LSTTSPRKFHLAYNIKYNHVPFSPEEFPTHGVADCLLVMALVKKLEGSTAEDEYSFVAMDGTTGELMDPADVWGAWVVLARMLLPRLEIEAARKAICEKALKAADELLSLESLRVVH